MCPKTKFALAVVVAALWTVPAAAQPASKPTSGESIKTARELMSRGVEALGRKDFEAARKLLAEAYAQHQSADIAANLGYAELELKDYVAAAGHLQYAMDFLPARSRKRERETVEGHLKAARSKVAAFRVKLSPRAAVMEIDGIEQSPGVVFLSPGSHQVSVTAEGYTSHAGEILGEVGEEQQVNFTLARADDTPKPIGNNPSTGPDGRMVGGVVMGAGALVGFGIGLGASLIAADKGVEAQALRNGLTASGCTIASDECIALKDAATSHDTARVVADGAFVTGGVLAAGSIGLLLWWAADDADDQPAEPAIVSVTPTVGEGLLGVTLRGVW